MDKYFHNPVKLDALFISAKPLESHIDMFIANKVPVPSSWICSIPLTKVPSHDFGDVVSSTFPDGVIPHSDPLLKKILSTKPSINALLALTSKGWIPPLSLCETLLRDYPQSFRRENLYYYTRQMNVEIVKVPDEVESLRKYSSPEALCRLKVIEKISKGPFVHNLDNEDEIHDIHPDYIYIVNVDGKRIGLNVMDYMLRMTKDVFRPSSSTVPYTGRYGINIPRDDMNKVYQKIIDLASRCYPLYYDGYQTASEGYGDYLYMYPIWDIESIMKYYRISPDFISLVGSDGMLLVLIHHPTIIYALEKDTSLSLTDAIKAYLDS